MSAQVLINPEALLAAARTAAEQAHAPYSRFPVGAALVFADGTVVTGANVENASYGLSLCAETVAVARAFNDGRRGGLVAVAIVATANQGEAGQLAAAVTPCGRCRQVLAELAMLDGSDPLVICGRPEGHASWRLSQLLPAMFGM